MNPLHEARELATSPELWPLELRDGSRLVVMAHGYAVRGTDVVFLLLFKGSPDFEVESLRLPLALLPERFADT